MKHLAKEVWLTAPTTIFVTTQITFQIAKARVKPLLDSNAHLQMNSPQMLSPENSYHTQDFLFQVTTTHILYVLDTSQESNTVETEQFLILKFLPASMLVLHMVFHQDLDSVHFN